MSSANCRVFDHALNRPSKTDRFGGPLSPEIKSGAFGRLIGRLSLQKLPNPFGSRRTIERFQSVMSSAFGANAAISRETDSG